MKTLSLPSTFVAVAALVSTAFGQDVLRPIEPPAAALSAKTKRLADWHLPVRSMDHPDTGASEVWASGPDYKVQFDGGVAFYPILGERYENNLPLQWKTRSVSLGATDIVSSEDRANASHSDWRYELDYGAVVESYDVKEAGVEQSFLIKSAPATPGDLVIRGRVQTDLVSDPRDPSHGALLFRSQRGEDIVSFGASIAFDATGRKGEVKTAFVNGEIQLVLGADWLAGAEYPVLVDPLFRNMHLAGDANPATAPDIARDDENDERMTTRVRMAAANDGDVWVKIYDDDGTNARTLYSNTTTANTFNATCAYVGGANRYVVTYTWFQWNPIQTRLLVVFLNDGRAAPAPITSPIPTAPGLQQSRPVLGGIAGWESGDEALLVYQQDPALFSTGSTAIMGMFINASSPAFGTVFPIASGGTLDRDMPTVTKSIDDDSAWLVGWQEYNNSLANDDWDIRARQVRRDGTMSTTHTIQGGTSTHHAILPKIAGRDGRYMLAWGRIDKVSKSYNMGFDSLRIRRFDWDDNGSLVPIRDNGIAFQANEGLSFGSGTCRPIAYDTNTRSHWALGWIKQGDVLEIVRLSYDASVVERKTVLSSPGNLIDGVSVAFDDDHETFGMHFILNDPAISNPAYMNDLAYHPAQAVSYGSTCHGTIDVANGLVENPYAGSEFMTVRLQNGIPNAPTILMISPSSASLPFSRGCFLNISPVNAELVKGSFTNGSGEMSFDFSIPGAPFITGDIYWQFIQIDSLANELVTSQAMRMEIR